MKQSLFCRCKAPRASYPLIRFCPFVRLKSVDCQWYRQSPRPLVRFAVPL